MVPFCVYLFFYVPYIKRRNKGMNYSFSLVFQKSFKNIFFPLRYYFDKNKSLRTKLEIMLP